MRAVDASKNQPHRRRCDRAREFQKFGRDVPNRRSISAQVTPTADSNLKVSHFFLLFVMFLLVVPAVKIFGRIFENYLCAPFPPELRLARAPRDGGDGAGGAPPSPDDEADEGGASPDVRGRPAAAGDAPRVVAVDADARDAATFEPAADAAEAPEPRVGASGEPHAALADADPEPSREEHPDADPEPWAWVAPLLSSLSECNDPFEGEAALALSSTGERAFIQSKALLLDFEVTRHAMRRAGDAKKGAASRSELLARSVSGIERSVTEKGNRRREAARALETVVEAVAAAVRARSAELLARAAECEASPRPEAAGVAATLRSMTGQEKGDSTSLQRECSARARFETAPTLRERSER